MSKQLKLAALAAAMCAFGSAGAATIVIDTAYSNAAAQASAADYASVVNTALLTQSTGYGSTSVSLYDNVTNTFGSGSNIAFKSTINFGVTGAASTWNFRAGVDFGNGGAVFLDGAALGSKSNDMWWAGSYGNASQFFQYSSTLAAGNHTLTIYGLENCCNGGQQVQYSTAGAAFQTFGSGTLAAVPEPETYAMLLAGLGLVGFMSRRRKA